MHLTSFLAPGVPAAVFEVIADAIDADLAFVTGRSGPDPAKDPFRDGRSDLGWICSTSFVELMAQPEPSVQLAGIAWVPDDEDAHQRPQYFSDLLVGPSSPVRRLEDLAGARIGCNDPVSLSGHLALRIALQQRGFVAGEFAELVFTGGHQHSLDLIQAGVLDAAVVDSVARIGRARRNAGVAALRVVERLGPWPTQPLVARADMVPADVARLRAGVLSVNDDPTRAAELRLAGIDRLVAVGADFCAGVTAAMADLQLGVATH